MKHRSLPNQYLLLETLKRRFNAEEKPLVKTGMERARELAEQAAELGEGDNGSASRGEALNRTQARREGAEGVAPVRSSEPSPSPSSVQVQLWGEAA